MFVIFCMVQFWGFGCIHHLDNRRFWRFWWARYRLVYVFRRLEKHQCIFSAWKRWSTRFPRLLRGMLKVLGFWVCTINSPEKEDYKKKTLASAFMDVLVCRNRMLIGVHGRLCTAYVWWGVNYETDRPRPPICLYYSSIFSHLQAPSRVSFESVPNDQRD